MTDSYLDDGILIRVLRCESLYSSSERKRCVALMLKQKSVPARVISELVGVSGQSIQGWWRDWQADPSFAAIIDRRRAYAVTDEERQQVAEYLAKDPPAGLDSWSMRSLAKVLRLKQQRVETILKLLCRDIPERIQGDDRLRSGVYERKQRSQVENGTPAEEIDPERQRLFSDTLQFIEQLESGQMPNEQRQQEFDNVLQYIEQREGARERGDEQEDDESVEPLVKRNKPEKKRDQHFEDALRFIEERERKRDE